MSMSPPTDSPAAPAATLRQRVAPPKPAAGAKKPRGQFVSRLFAGLGASLTRRPQRPATLAFVAAFVGLAVAGASLLHPAPKDMTSVPAGAVALVNQKPILMTDFMSETETAAGVPFDQSTPAQRAEVLHRMIDEELMVQRSLALDLPEQDVDVRNAMIDGVTAQVNLETAATRPQDDQLRAFFNANRANYANQGSMNLTDLVLHIGGFENADQSLDQAMADAAQAVYELRSGETVDHVKQHFGFVDSGKLAAGDQWDFAARIHLGPKLYAAAGKLSDGEISDPVADTDGVHVIVMQHRQAPVFTDFDTVRNNVYSDYSNKQKAKAKQENIDFLRSSAQILIAPGQRE